MAKLTKQEIKNLYAKKIEKNPELAKKVRDTKRLSVFSRHPSHDIFRAPQLRLEARTSIRFGSQTVGPSTYDVNLNNPLSIRVSANKLLMKQAFNNHSIRTAIWYTYDMHKKVFVDSSGRSIGIGVLTYPIVSKQLYGSRNQGNRKHDTVEELQDFLDTSVQNPLNYIFEKFYNYSTEYRVHGNTRTGECFYSLRKMIKKDAPKKERWYRNDKHCVWITEDSDTGLFDKPDNWAVIQKQCIAALNSVGLDLGAVDIRIQSSTLKNGNKRVERNFIILETNSAPSFGDRTAQEYLKQIKLIASQWAKNNPLLRYKVF